MTQLKKETETLVTSQPDDRMQKVTVSAISYDIVLGTLHGTLQALACASLNPLDKKNAELVTCKKQPVIPPGNVLTETALEAKPSPIQLQPAMTSSSNAQGPEPAATQYKYNWRTQYQNFKNFFPSQPWAGTLYGIQTNVPRNIVVFTALPLLRDELEEYFTPGQSKVIAGTGTGIVETLFTARNRVIKTIMHTSPDKAGLSHKEVWQSLPAVARGEKIKAAIKWGAAKGIAYWVTFPVLSQLCEVQVKKAVDHFQLGDSYAVAGASYLLAGAVAGTVTPLFSYPLDVLEKRAILNPAKNQWRETWDYYCRFGLHDSIKYNTHVGFIKTAMPRMMISSAFFNLTMHMAKSACDAVFVKREHHPQSVAVPAIAHYTLATPPAPKLSEPVVVSGVVSLPTQALPVAAAPTAASTPGGAARQDSLGSVVPPALYGAQGLFSRSAQFSNSGVTKMLAGTKPLPKPDPKQLTGFYGPLFQQILASQRTPVAAPASNSQVESVKRKV